MGKSEDGIVQALKPKPKHGSHGIGHDIAEEFTNHWWQKLYNKAAENIEVPIQIALLCSPHPTHETVSR